MEQRTGKASDTMSSKEQVKELGEELISVLIRETGELIVKKIKEIFSNPSDRFKIHGEVKKAINNPSPYTRKELEDLKKALDYFLSVNIMETPSIGKVLIPVYGLIRFGTNQIEYQSLTSLQDKLKKTIHLRDYMEYLEIYRTGNFENEYFNFYDEHLEKFKDAYDKGNVAVFLAFHQVYSVQGSLSKLYKEFRNDENIIQRVTEEIDRKIKNQIKIEEMKLKGF